MREETLGKRKRGTRIESPKPTDETGFERSFKRSGSPSYIDYYN
ncbi:MAG: hypothetical protein ACXAEI_06965 [Candidatus Hodarchaeales archaeon]